MNKLQIRNSLIYIVSDVLVKALPFFLIPIVTKYLTLEEYGEVSLVLTFIDVCTIILIFGSHHFYRYEFFSGSKPKDIIFITVVLISTLNFVILEFFSLIFFFSWKVAEIWYVLIPITSFFQSVVSLYICKFQTIERPVYVGTINFIQSILGFTLTIIILKLGGGVDGRLFVVLLIPVILGSLGLLNACRKLSKTTICQSIGFIREGLSFGSKAFPSSLSWWLRAGMDRVLIMHLVGTAAVGTYSLAMQLALCISVIAGALNNSIMPSIYKGVNENNDLFVTKIIVKASIIIAFISLGGALIFPIIIDYLLPVEYKVVKDIITPILLATLCHAIFLFCSNVLVANKLVGVLSWISLSSAFIHFSISFVLAYFWGINGIVWSGFITYSISVVFIMAYYKFLR